jgi:hypothetical protein
MADFQTKKKKIPPSSRGTKGKIEQGKKKV